MRNSILTSMAVVLAFLFTLVLGAGVFAQDFVQVSPATILLGAEEQQSLVTVHVAIPFDPAFDVVLLVGEQEEILVKDIFADDCGDLVAQFDSTQVKRALEAEVNIEELPSDVELILSITGDGTEYYSDTVRVVEFSGPGTPPGK